MALFLENISPTSAGEFVRNVKSVLAGDPIEITCKPKDISRETFFSANPDCNKLERDLSNFTKAVNGTLKLSMPTNRSFKGSKMFACTWKFQDESRSGEECLEVDVGNVPQRPTILCEAPSETEVRCRMQPSREVIESNTGLCCGYHLFNVSVAAGSDLDDRMLRCSQSSSCDSKCCVFPNDVVKYVSETNMSHFQMKITIQNSLGEVSTTVHHDLREMLLLRYKLSHSFDAGSSKAIFSWKVLNRAWQTYMGNNETEILCTSEDFEQKFHRKVLNNSVTTLKFTAAAYFCTYVCKHRSRLIFGNITGIWSKYQRVIFKVDPLRAPHMPVPQAFPGMIVRRDEDCRFYFFDSSGFSEEFAIRVKGKRMRKKGERKYLNFKFFCPPRFSLVLDIAAKTSGNAWSNDTTVTLSSRRTCPNMTALKLKFKKLSEDRFYQALPLSFPGKLILDAFLVVCFCDSCSYSVKCTKMHRIPYMTKQPLTFKQFEVDPEKERVALFVIFQRFPSRQTNCSFMSDWSGDFPSDVEKSESFEIYLVLLSLVLIIAFLIAGIKARKKKLVVCWQIISEDPTTVKFDGREINSSENYKDMDKNYDFPTSGMPSKLDEPWNLSAPGIPSKLDESRDLPTGTSAKSQRSGYTPQDNLTRRPSYTQQGVPWDQDLPSSSS